MLFEKSTDCVNYLHLPDRHLCIDLLLKGLLKRRSTISSNLEVQSPVKGKRAGIRHLSFLASAVMRIDMACDLWFI